MNIRRSDLVASLAHQSYNHRRDAEKLQEDLDRLRVRYGAAREDAEKWRLIADAVAGGMEPEAVLRQIETLMAAAPAPQILPFTREGA